MEPHGISAWWDKTNIRKIDLFCEKLERMGDFYSKVKLWKIMRVYIAD